ncbi:hypothetical protein UFOVP450_121 [uncultured Caudovirales phage]|uniref:2TM domain-containing protein n=1 Tax=uncultured Caudovirales phage TaxID=2100421 RepID=A0A6J5M8K9_9CAUD|nr:hypothetical protein UFOVP450_121 [uncultured Caudovirales phage]
MRKVLFTALLFIIANAGMLWLWLITFRSPLPWVAWIGVVTHIFVLFSLPYHKMFNVK